MKKIKMCRFEQLNQKKPHVTTSKARLESAKDGFLELPSCF